MITLILNESSGLISEFPPPLHAVRIRTIEKESIRKKLFCFEDVVTGINEKLIRRHPHIFEENEIL